MSTESLLARAAKYLETASFLLERDPESSVSRSYYAMFFAAKALLNVHGIRTRISPNLRRSYQTVSQSFPVITSLTKDDSAWL